jgi:SAM-dependent methyltransferase
MSERLVEVPYLYNNVKKNSRVLDVGVDRVGYTDYLIGMGCQVFGCDPLVRDCAFPIKFQDIAEDVEKFDVIVFLSTIEHFNPSQENWLTHQTEVDAILKARRLLKPDGVIIVTVPFGKGGILNDDAVQWDLQTLCYIQAKSDSIIVDECVYKCGLVNNNDVWKLCKFSEVMHNEFYHERGHASAVYLGVWK